MKKIIAVVFGLILLISIVSSVLSNANEWYDFNNKDIAGAPVKLPPVPPRD